jgi:hypothetical protein
LTKEKEAMKKKGHIKAVESVDGKKQSLPAPPTKLDEADRVVVAEKLYKRNMLINALAVLKADMNSLAAEEKAMAVRKELAQLHINNTVVEVQKYEEEFSQFLKEFKDAKGIPQHMEINIESGDVFQPPPQNTAPGQPIMPRVVPNEDLPPHKNRG